MKKPTPKKPTKRDGKLTTFHCTKDSERILLMFTKQGYTRKDLINFAISELPSLMGGES